MICTSFLKRSALIAIIALVLPGALDGAPAKKRTRDKHLRFRIQKSENYDLYTNASGRGALNRILKQLETARADFIRYLPPGERQVLPRGSIRLFRSREQYIAAVGAEFKWSGGLWNGKELLISPLPEEYSRNQNRKFIREVIFHEGFHQYLSGILGNIPAGMWFNEGCAQLFEDIDSRGSIILTRKQERELAAAVKKYPVPAKTLMMLNHKQFYEKNMRAGNYQTSHALLYYLFFGAPAERSPYAGIPKRYLQLLLQYRHPDRAMNKLASEFDLNKLDSDFRNFWQSSSKRNAARAYSRDQSR